MIGTLKLLLPALIPSWRFFDIIAPSPRVEFTLYEAKDQEPLVWEEFRPRPQHVSFLIMLRRMVWNPRWNESLFVMSCSERLMQNPTAPHSQEEIFKRIEHDLIQSEKDLSAKPYVQFRLVFISRQGSELRSDIAYISPVRRWHGGGRS